MVSHPVVPPGPKPGAMGGQAGAACSTILRT